MITSVLCFAAGANQLVIVQLHVKRAGWIKHQPTCSWIFKLDHEYTLGVSNNNSTIKSNVITHKTDDGFDQSFSSCSIIVDAVWRFDLYPDPMSSNLIHFTVLKSSV